MNRKNYSIYVALLYAPVLLLSAFFALAELDHESMRSVFLMGIGYVALIFIPTITFSVRRLHDANMSGKWLWVLVAAPALTLFLPVTALLAGNERENKYGYPERYSPFDNKSGLSLVFNIIVLYGLLMFASIFALIIVGIVVLLIALALSGDGTRYIGTGYTNKGEKVDVYK